MVRDALAGLPEVYVNLYVALAPGRRGAVERRAPGFESQVPLDVRVSDLMARIAGRRDPEPGVVLLWAASLRAHLGMPPAAFSGHSDPLRPGTGPALRDACGFLGRHVAELLDMDVAAGEELVELYEQARTVLGLNDADTYEHLRDPLCPGCKTRTLLRPYGTESILCGRCLSRWGSLTDVATRETG